MVFNKCKTIFYTNRLCLGYRGGKVHRVCGCIGKRDQVSAMKWRAMDKYHVMQVSISNCGLLLVKNTISPNISYIKVRCINYQSTPLAFTLATNIVQLLHGT